MTIYDKIRHWHRRHTIDGITWKWQQRQCNNTMALLCRNFCKVLRRVKCEEEKNGELCSRMLFKNIMKVSSRQLSNLIKSLLLLCTLVVNLWNNEATLGYIRIELARGEYIFVGCLWSLELCPLLACLLFRWCTWRW